MTPPHNPIFHVVEASIRYLTETEGGRKRGVADGFKGRFLPLPQSPRDSKETDHWAEQWFPETGEGEFIRQGETLRVMIRFPVELIHSSQADQYEPGMLFAIREGSKIVATGTVTGRIRNDKA
ncbi:MAG: hypothetical protein AAF907_03730 [Planctomycetota bacterium]